MIEMPQYVTREEVQRVCKELGIRDWTALTEPVVQPEEAEKILTQVNVKAMPVTVEDFRQGLEVELEHGTRFDDANVTNNHPILTGMIVLAHLKETLDYYQRIDVAELEGDLVKAVVAGDVQKTRAKYKKLLAARRTLCEAESKQIT